MHAGALSHIAASPWAPSAIQPVGHPFSARDRNFFLPKEMSQTDIRLAVEGFANAAKMAHEAGFDGVEIHAANGYLPDQFITPHTNLRADEYGGNAENRMRFVAEIVNAIRGVVPKEFIVGLRMSEGKVNDLAYRWESGPEEAQALFAEVKKINPDYLHIAAEVGGWKRECQYADGNSSTGIAVQMLTCPVIANGGLHDFDLAGELLNSHQADLLAIGRYALANPDLPLKLKRGERPIPFDKAMLEAGLHLSDTERYFQKLDCRASI